MSSASTTDEARRAYLIALRKSLGFTQAKMARELGMSLRSYSDLETGEARCRSIHALAAERVTLSEAASRSDAHILALPVRKDLITVAGLGQLPEL